jgi:hypothetical protein
VAVTGIKCALERAGMELVELKGELAAGGLDADVLIVHRNSTEVTDAYTRLIQANPAIRILTLTAAPRHEMFEFRFFDFRFFGTNVKGEDVVDAVRDVMRHPIPSVYRAGN